ncbi:hypothetical protein [Janthinobacterium sp. HLX7-2]|uniref:hypothetical protein n=1 Tax=Janthinobacterium sp. HLX7-2 TaxID=1259331 RepID=UPI003F28AE10
MTPAARYIAGIYESAVDRQLNVEAIRLHLAECGIRRSPAQVAHDLTHTYGFHGYADSYPAPPVKTMAELDAELGE